MILANPPYSIKQWNREAWSSDKWGRNSLGTPPQGRADYAFQQHILTSLTAKGRCAVLWPHGVLFRNEEQAMRAKMIEQDWVEAVIGLGPNLFYNSPMESCIVICNRKKTAARKGKVIFIDAVNEVTRERAQSFLKPGAPAAHPDRLQDLCGCARFRQGRHTGRDRRQQGQPVDPAVCEAHCRRHRNRQQWRRRYRCAPLGTNGKPMAGHSGCRWTRLVETLDGLMRRTSSVSDKNKNSEARLASA